MITTIPPIPETKGIRENFTRGVFIGKIQIIDQILYSGTQTDREQQGIYDITVRVADGRGGGTM